jgi:hypothetical protein
VKAFSAGKVVVTVLCSNGWERVLVVEHFPEKETKILDHDNVDFQCKLRLAWHNHWFFGDLDPHALSFDWVLGGLLNLAQAWIGLIMTLQAMNAQ